MEIQGQWCRTDDQNDKPEDWLGASLVFAKALGFLLKETEGVVIIPENDIKTLFPNAKCLIVSKRNGQTHISASDEEFADGQLVWTHE